MLKRLLFLIVILLFSIPVSAQEVSPPTIVHFAADVDSISLAELEYSGVWITFNWHIVGMTGNYRAVVEQYISGLWQPLDAIRAGFPGYDQQAERVSMMYSAPHPLNFGPLMFRLRVVDISAALPPADEWVITIPYEIPDPVPTPEIQSFQYWLQPENPSLNSTELQQRTARLFVGWTVINRLPTSNLRFEQIFGDGTVQSVEMPRLTRWIGSQGGGELTPFMPQSMSGGVVIRLQVFDVRDGTVYDEQLLTVPVTGPVAPSETLIPSDDGFALPAGAQLISFTATPDTVTEGESVTLTWEVQGTDRVDILINYLTQPIRQWVGIADQPSIGSITVPVPLGAQSVTYMMQFSYLNIALGEPLVVNIRCRLNWFSGVQDVSYCPTGEPQTLELTYQQFQNGFMLGHEGKVWVLFADGTGFLYDFPERNEQWTRPIEWSQTPSEGYSLPQGGFGIVWTTDEQVRQGLGWAAQPEQHYQSQVQSAYFETLGAREISYITLPDNTIINLDIYGKHLISWRINPGTAQ